MKDVGSPIEVAIDSGVLWVISFIFLLNKVAYDIDIYGSQAQGKTISANIIENVFEMTSVKNICKAYDLYLKRYHGAKRFNTGIKATNVL